jgi:site-specific DNA-cytosine methylase
MKAHSEKSMCLAGNFVDRNTNQNGSGVKEDTSFTLNTVDRHAVAYRELQYDSYIEDDVSGTLKKSGGALGGGSETVVCEEREQPDWIVRRLIPLECSRLQGFPDGWAEIESLKNPKEFNFWREVYARSCEIKKTKPKQTILRADGAKSDEALMRWHDGLHSLAAEYAMWGNGMALPNAIFFVQNAFRELGKPPHEVKLGSLFDGSGTMPLCAAMCGGHPVWASEVEPYPIAVTRTHLPNMKHLGSVTEIKGSKIEPVDIITFGSPCQDLSIAGKRAGLKGERSGLFREAIRIIREMLAATNGRYPRFVIWENVPGALSSNGGEDFEVVLNELLGLREFTGGGAAKFIRQHGKWRNFANYGAVAYRIVNAQFWGVPQRRRRIYAICDTCGESAGVVVFERKGTQWNFDPCIPQGGGEVAGLTADCYSWHDRMVASKPSEGGAAAYTMKIRGGCEGGGKGALVQEELSATLATHQDQTLFESHGCFPINTMLATRYKALGRGTGLGIGNDGDPQYTITKGHEHAVAYSVGDVPDTAFANAGDTVARTLTARADGSPMIDRGPNIVTQKGK